MYKQFIWNIRIAKLHAKEMGLDIKYFHSAPENFKFSSKYDVILNMEVQNFINLENIQKKKLKKC